MICDEQLPASEDAPMDLSRGTIDYDELQARLPYLESLMARIHELFAQRYGITLQGNLLRQNEQNFTELGNGS